jgi:hypothetical protein
MDSKEETDEVELICVKVDGKLRVRILHKNYSGQANCQFPRDLRVEGRRFMCHVSAITPSKIKNTWFYRINKKGIRILDGVKAVKSLSESLKSVKIYEDVTEDICGICFVNPKCIVNVPCGHYFFCEDCSKNLQKDTCPICRCKISDKVHIKEFL